MAVSWVPIQQRTEEEVCDPLLVCFGGGRRGGKSVPVQDVPGTTQPDNTSY